MMTQFREEWAYRRGFSQAVAHVFGRLGLNQHKYVEDVLHWRVYGDKSEMEPAPELDEMTIEQIRSLFQ
jgi:hypothetical protein